MSGVQQLSKMTDLINLTINYTTIISKTGYSDGRMIKNLQISRGEYFLGRGCHRPRCRRNICYHIRLRWLVESVLVAVFPGILPELSIIWTSGIP